MVYNFINKLLLDSLSDEQFASIGFTRQNAEQVLRCRSKVVIGTVIIVFFVGIISWLLDLLAATMAVMVGFMPLRSAFGGFHLKRLEICWFVSVGLFLGLGFLADKIGLYIVTILIVLEVMIGSFTILRIGVVDTSQIYITRPEERAKRQEKLKRNGIMRFILLNAAVGCAYLAGYKVITAGVTTGMISAFSLLYLTKDRYSV